jgi:hypothetical protein
MAKRKPDVIQRFVNQIERNARKLKKDLQRFSKNADLPHKLDELAGELRRSAASVASEVEHYLHDLRSGAAKAGKAAEKSVRKAARKTPRKTAKKAATKRARKTAKKATKRTVKKRARKTRS